MPDPQAAVDEYADGTPYLDLADGFLEFGRAPGDRPVLLVAEAAASTTGQNYADGIQPTVERFRKAFVETDRVGTFADVAGLDLEDEDLVEAFGAQRKRHVLQEVAQVLDRRPEDDDLEAYKAWAAEADVYRYEADPVGEVSGVGPATFQYLRMLAGIDTAKPDPPLEALISELAGTVPDSPVDASTPLRAVASAEWLSYETSYRWIDIDRIAWWVFTDET